MYEAFFGLSKRPFLAAPLVDRYYPAASIESSRQTLARCIDRAEGAAMLIGPSGTGKTLVMQLLAEQFRDRMDVVLLSNSHLTTRRALLQAIMFELGMPYRGMEEGELRLALIDRLTPRPDVPDGLLLLIDEAHALPLRLMEEVRMITNVVRDGQPRARLVMAGGPTLEEHLARPKLASMSQRLSARCYLQSLNESETMGYVCAQLDAVGASAKALFTDEALKAIHRATDGVPRLINQLCDHALLQTFHAEQSMLDGAAIEEAWADLQRLPAPWNEASKQEALASASERADDIVVPNEPIMIDPVAKPQPIMRPQTTVAARVEPTDVVRPAPERTHEAPMFIKDKSNPFAEHFADEEVIFDRYASCDVGMAGRGRVYSAEGGALSAMLEPFLQPIQVEPREVGQRETASRTNHCESNHCGGHCHEESATIRIESHDSDRDMIIIEDDVQAPSTNGAKPVRHHEYRQLFASLRRE
jgi:type II secretory pathway predicted ATPase ExeA